MPDLTSADDRDLNEALHAFKAAASAQRTALSEPPLNRLLVALDGSNQDDTTLALAQAVAQRADDPVLHLLYAWEGRADAERDAYVDRRRGELRDAGFNAVAVEGVDHGQRSFTQILNATQAARAELVVVDAPYLDDFEELGGASVGTNLGVLLARSTAPLLVVREPLENAAACLDHLMLGLTLHPLENVGAAGWTLRLVGSGGHIRVLAVADRAALDATPMAVEGDRDLAELDEQFLAGLRRPDVAGLIAALHREAGERGVGCRVSVRLGEIVPTMSELTNAEPCLTVMGCPRDPSHAAYQRVEGFIRAARYPVLVA